MSEWKTGTRAPDGATPDGVLAEHDAIEERCGKATVEASAREVLRAPGDYPNLTAFCPDSTEEAVLIATKDAIRKAYRSVIFERAPRSGASPPREIRVLHGVRDDSGERVYQHLNVIREDPKSLRRLVADLRGDAEAYASKMRNVLSEIESAL